jgi:hypothetical protein
MMGQVSAQRLQGEFYLRGVMEVSSGFKFNEDHTFEFFFAYGALDRIAKGSWMQYGDSIILNNSPKPSLDFKLLRAEKNGKKEITIKITGANQMVLRNIYGSVKYGDSVLQKRSDQKGTMTFEKHHIEKISLIHEFWPDRFSVFDVDDPAKDYFEFSIEPWIADVEFKNFVLILKDNLLVGSHPTLEKKNTITSDSNICKSRG